MMAQKYSSRLIAMQHETDHLDGRLFIDHLSYLKRSLYDKKVRKAR